jgi:predicted tellurium resistance membrane protein TerC
MNALFNQWDVVVILLQIIAIDLLLGGDNAVVIAMACRKLPPEQRTKAIVIGTFGAILARVLLLAIAVYLLSAVAKNCRGAPAAVDRYQAGCPSG